MPVTSTCTVPATPRQKRWLAHTLLPIRFNPTNEWCEAPSTLLPLTLRANYAMGAKKLFPYRQAK